MIDGAYWSVNQGLTTSDNELLNVPGKGLRLIDPAFNVPLFALSTLINSVHPAVLKLRPDVVPIVTLGPPFARSALLSSPRDHARLGLSNTLKIQMFWSDSIHRDRSL
jgi:hypothetical protein